MRQDRVEVPTIYRRLQRQRRRITGRRTDLAHAQQNGDSVRPLEVIDEAFAGFTRIDAGAPRPDMYSQIAASGGDALRECAIDRDILTTLSAQLKALDGQRDQLSRLLQTVDGLAD